MSEGPLISVKKLSWVNIVFFSVTGILGLIGAPLYAFRYGLANSEILLFVFYVAATGLSITMGYHRLFAHTTYKTHPVVEFLLLFFGAAAFQQPALKWAAQHRTHHLYADTERDPYNIRKGFFYAHIGWLIFWEHPVDYSNSPDLSKKPLIRNQDKYYVWWAAGSGIVLPVLIGAWTGHPAGAFLWAVCLRITLVYQATFCINSLCHTLGRSTYDAGSTAKDHWLAALITFGEGYHNYHHRFPMDYRNGVRWYHWDPTKWAIALLAALGLARDLKKVSELRILEARQAAARQRTRTAVENATVSV